jgi:hypothetical protein
MCADCHEKKTGLIDFTCKQCHKERKRVPKTSDKPCGDPRVDECAGCEDSVWFCNIDCYMDYMRHREFVACNDCETKCDKCAELFCEKDLNTAKCKPCKRVLDVCGKCDEHDLKCAQCEQVAASQSKAKKQRKQ